MVANPVKSCFDVVNSTRNGRPTIAIQFGGQEVAVIAGLRRGFGKWLFRPRLRLLINPAPQGRRWTLPLMETITLFEDVCKHFGIRDAKRDPDVVGSHDTQGHFVKLRFDAKQWAEVRRFEDGERVTITEIPPRGLPMLEVKSALRRALSISRSADPWELSDVTLDDFSIVENTVGVEILIGGEKWIEVTRRGAAMCTKMFAQSNFRPWTMPYDAVVSVLSDVRSRLRVNHRHDQIEEEDSPEEIRIELSVCSPPDREWLTVSLDLAIDDIPGWQWAEVDQEGPELQIQVYFWDEIGDLSLPLDHVIRRLRDAKVALLDTADRPPVRRPVVPSVGRRPVELGGDAAPRAESAAVFVRQAPSGLAVYYGDRRFASLPRDTSPTLEVEAPSDDGGWELPLAAVMDTLGELLKRAGLEEADDKPREDVVFCPRAVGSGTTVEIRFGNGLRAKMREHDDEVRIDLGSRGSAGKPWRLPLPQAIATLRWALAMLRAAGPWSQTNISREDFGAETHRDGVDLLVAGENWGKVRSRDSEVQMEFVERADMRPWILPYEPVIAALESAEEMVLADPRTASGRVVADDESVGAEAETLRQWQSLPSDRSEQVLECYFRDEEGWVQWAEVNQDGPESQVEIYSWPGCRRFAFPIRQVIERLGEAKAMFPGDES